MEILIHSFEYFSKASGLVMNRGKSSIYYNSNDEHLIKEVEEITSMKRGSVPFKYLGINVSPKRLSILDCSSLVERIVERIKKLGSRKLSYAGRIVLIKSVLSSLHTYWARIFVLPKTVIARIEATSKYAWWITTKADHLWVRWVHAIYINSGTWSDYEPSPTSSWAWRKICQVKNIFKEFLFQSDWSRSGQSYTIGKGYKWLMPEKEQVRWFPWINQRWMLPKHSFCNWLIVQQRLLTQDRLVKMHIRSQNYCYLCGVQEESHAHLFFDCVYSRKCRVLVSYWCQHGIISGLKVFYGGLSFCFRILEMKSV
ncbi:uncharacterized protein LOC141648954 [Silene latifolia]|uniref:uncharacterized protein LOC141648954 n=1 Tax=Silene latifolia TaxID=37657 RepID=UPI003D780A57